ncbi:MAG TPA: CHAD domain-containing protein [Ramlibacter sp.]|jgi:inorganic triphosphatase YgiF|uniref:CYTH and CHAD domain-containing protein n=1 Tax=Ramlibacter sp. TaxID=1917967 RepID=UPI002D376D64|nr:CHAD domain-containing protein [Ramlibacter sp.]HZY17944.1 CHAD domain-containing protein [Ramlibacter sp.]
MTEFELKLEIPVARLDEVAAEVASEPVQRVRLRALYLDTPDQALARHGVALRLRLEGDRWVQTAKGPGSGPVERLEHNVPLPDSAAATPAADPGRHDGTPLSPRIREALGCPAGDAFPPLQVTFETDVERTLRDVREGASVLELALDQGRLLAAGRSHVVRELEVELKDGDPADAVQLARRWAGRHGLWLSATSKAQRGRLLAAGQVTGAPVGADPVACDPDAGSGEFVAAVLASCLAQVIGNASEIAAGSNADDHVHQLRVGIRRLRTALRELQALAPLDAGAEPALVDAFRALGAHRDWTHVTRLVAPQLLAAGGPPLETAPHAPALAEPGEVVRAPAFQDALFDLLAQQVRVGRQPGKPRKALRRALQRLWRQVTREGERFTELDEPLQHRVRKRLKRLRYLAEFSQPLFTTRRVQAFVRELKPVQDALGLNNDEAIALAAWRRLAQDDPKALFGAGWLSARRAPLARAGGKALRRLSRVKPFWR